MCVNAYDGGLCLGGMMFFQQEQEVLFQSLFLLSFRRKALTSPPLYSSTVDELDLERSEATGPDRVESGRICRPRQWVGEVE
jgi:hypothetical protein